MFSDERNEGSSLIIQYRGKISRFNLQFLVLELKLNKIQTFEAKESLDLEKASAEEIFSKLYSVVHYEMHKQNSE